MSVNDVWGCSGAKQLLRQEPCAQCFILQSDMIKEDRLKGAGEPNI